MWRRLSWTKSPVWWGTTQLHCVCVLWACSGSTTPTFWSPQNSLWSPLRGKHKNLHNTSKMYSKTCLIQHLCTGSPYLFVSCSGIFHLTSCTVYSDNPVYYDKNSLPGMWDYSRNESNIFFGTLRYQPKNSVAKVFFLFWVDTSINRKNIRFIS